MIQELTLMPADTTGLRWAQQQVTLHHYLHHPVDVRCRPLAYLVQWHGQPLGCLIFGRPQCTRVLGWFGHLSDVKAGRCRYSQWEILNLARVYILPEFQRGGGSYHPDLLPGFTDRKGVWRSTLASTAIEIALDRVVVDYNLLWPPVYLDQPWELRECLSYCNSHLHRGTLYRASNFRLVRTNTQGIETYARPLRRLTYAERAEIARCSAADPRARRLRTAKTVTQAALFEEAVR